MKNLFLFGFVFLLFSSCAEEKHLELRNPESFVYALDSGWELNASVIVSGFEQQEIDEKYFTKLSYTIDIVTPAGDTLFNADDGVIDEENEEEIMDLSIETQIEFDSTFSKGKYILIYKVEDNFKPQFAEITDTVRVED